ncbi:MAG: hypothetical protein ACE5I2_00770 [Anaerolineae bacterium]
MRELRYTLVANGSSDVALIPILTWLLIENGVEYAIQPEWADLRWIHRSRRSRKLVDRIRLSLELFPCDLLFVHRDAEREPREKRVDEINKAIEEVVESYTVPCSVCVVPVRMQEAWLLFDETAIRHASGNRSGRQPLNLPPIRRLEEFPDPKSGLHDLLRQASGLRGRRLNRFPVSYRARRVTEFIDDFSPLRALSAFAALESDIKQIIDQQGWF